MNSVKQIQQISDRFDYYWQLDITNSQYMLLPSNKNQNIQYIEILLDIYDYCQTDITNVRYIWLLLDK